MIAISDRLGNASQGLTKEDFKKIPKYHFRKTVHGEKEGQDPYFLIFI